MKAIWARIGRQCSCFSVGVLWSMSLRSFIRGAEVSRTDDIREVVSMKRLERTELEVYINQDYPDPF